MVDTLCIDTFRDRMTALQPARIEQLLEAGRHSVERLRDLLKAFQQASGQEHELEVRNDLIAELAIAHAYRRALADAIAKARCGPYSIASRRAGIDELRQALEELTIRVRSAGVPWPQTWYT